VRLYLALLYFTLLYFNLLCFTLLYEMSIGTIFAPYSAFQETRARTHRFCIVSAAHRMETEECKKFQVLLYFTLLTLLYLTLTLPYLTFHPGDVTTSFSELPPISPHIFLHARRGETTIKSNRRIAKALHGFFTDASGFGRCPNMYDANQSSMVVAISTTIKSNRRIVGAICESRPP
jgi:hypothetical protein